MLTTAAWNAFLKTLEEPPPNTIFVLATTEAHKVLPTVVDRCHRFDFARPSVPQIAGVLRRVADRESISVPDEAVALVARSATGSFRDALGTLEQLVAYSGSEIASRTCSPCWAPPTPTCCSACVDAIAAGDQREALLAAARLAESGRDLGRFFGDLEAHARGLMVVQTLGEVPAELRVTAEQDERLAEQARRVGPADRRPAAGADRRRAARDEGRRRRPHPARARAAEGRRPRPTTRPSRRCWPAWSGSRAARAAPPGRARRRRARRTSPPPPPGAPPSRSPRRSRASRPWRPPPRSPARPGRPGGGDRDGRRGRRRSPAELATEADPRPVAAVAVVEPVAPAPEPSFAAAVDLSPDAFAELWPAVLESLQEESPHLAAFLQRRCRCASTTAS